MKIEKGTANGKIWLKNKMRPYRASILLLTALSVLATASSLGFAYLVKYLFNSATNGSNRLLWIFAAALLGLLLLKISLKTIDSFYAEKLRAKIVLDLRSKTFSKILRSEYEGITEYHSGELLHRLTSDINEVSAYTVGLLPAIVGMSVQVLGAIIALLTIDPLFTCVYVICGIAFCGIAALFRKQLKKRHKDVLQADETQRAFMQEGITSIMTLKAYSAEDKTGDRTTELGNSYYKKRMKRNVLRAGMSGVVSLLSNAGLILAVVWGAIQLLNNPTTTDFGAILSVILLLMQFQQPLSSFSSIMPAYYARLASGERLAEIEDIPTENLEKVHENVDFSDIEFCNLSFSYGRESVIKNATLTIKKGEIVCLKGASGSGKSTIFKLLLSVYKPKKGEILLKNKGDCIKLTAEHRGLFAYVPQGNFLFSGSIYENLTFFCEDKVNDEKVYEALKTACALFAYDLPEGLNTPLMERGAGLSEGQMQRLAVARAILSNRPVLLLDESTSALDGNTEKELLKNIKNLQDKTCLIVTHREAALSIADKILTVEDGNVIE